MIELHEIISKWLADNLNHYSVQKGYQINQFDIICQCYGGTIVFATISENVVYHTILLPVVSSQPGDPEFFAKVKNKLLKDHKLVLKWYKVH